MGMPFDSIGYLPRKPDQVRESFSSYNFSFILAGRGEFRAQGKVWPVAAPCVFIQWPDENENFGGHLRKFFRLISIEEKTNFSGYSIDESPD